MKFFISLACVFVAVGAMDEAMKKELLEEIFQVGNKCIAEVNASPDELKDLLAHKIPTSHEGQCLIFCYHKFYKVQNDDGSINPQGALQSLEKVKKADEEVYSKLLTVISNCGANTAIDNDPCVTAAALATCAITEGKKVGLGPEIFEM